MTILREMTAAEYDVWIKHSRESYRDEIIKNGSTKAEADKKMEDDFNRLLPDGQKSADHYIFHVEDNGVIVGHLWFGVRGASDNRKAFIYDIEMDSKFRGKGYGEKSMLLLEAEVKKLGLKHIGLHVFGHNQTAINLYKKLNYGITNLNMEKVLE